MPAFATIVRDPQGRSTLQRYNATTLQRYNATTLQRYNATTLKKYAFKEGY
ncbi:hypothetical protein [Candidatus Sororendozoicomonas aggregata]|uniref:hypothetical protein n=1 Tax=Candidatus Sororendozoicomonas aggregata TaxID=3073239 RepID=UPI002ED19C87